ncbi:cyanophycinase [Chitinophaga sp.]|uniref:cyanophycinase n=1 Tax=Chitinophaga sp. TaxID=1869181 RepID=UPI0031DCA62F
MKNIFFIACMLSALVAQAQSKVGPDKGSLVIVGGGEIGPEIWAEFVKLAGGSKARIIYVPTAQEDSTIARSQLRTIRKLRDAGAADVTVLHTRDPKVANTPAFTAPIRQATGVWFEGGRQWRIADAFLNTLTHREFNALLARGGVIGGTSAGATIIGSFLVRGDTKGNTILVGDHVEGLGFVRNVAIDQHLLKRNRQFDLVEVVRTRPELLGIGIDESTAVIVSRDTFRVEGRSYVAIYDPARLTASPGPFFYLQAGQRFNLAERQVIPVPKPVSSTASN